MPAYRRLRVTSSKQIPVEADAYILRNIIHDWDDEAAASILRTLRKSVKKDSRVMLVEWLIPETPGLSLRQMD